MIKLSDLILEAKNRPKVVVMAGGAGVGKSYLLNQLDLGSLPQVNPDKYVEDPQHPAYNNLKTLSLPANIIDITNHDFTFIILTTQDIIYQYDYLFYINIGSVDPSVPLNFLVREIVFDLSIYKVCAYENRKHIGYILVLS